MSILGLRKSWTVLVAILAGCVSVPPDDPVVAALKDNVDQVHFFQTVPYLELASALQALSETERAAFLRAWAADEKNDVQIYFLCRMLFDARENDSLRPPRVVALAPLEGVRAEDWPQWPLAFADGIPFCLAYYAIVDDITLPLTSAVSYAGERDFHPAFRQAPRNMDESGAEYLGYCMRNGVWTARKYVPVGSAQLDAALTKLLQSPRWGTRAPSVKIEEFLAEQISCDCAPARREARGTW